MSHSFAPNCAHSVFPNKTLALQVEIDADGGGVAVADDVKEIRFQAKVKILAGTEFTISYISPLQVDHDFDFDFYSETHLKS